MKIKIVTYIILIITGLLFIFNKKSTNFDSFFGIVFVVLGMLNIIIDFMRKGKENEEINNPN